MQILLLLFFETSSFSSSFIKCIFLILFTDSNHEKSTFKEEIFASSRTWKVPMGKIFVFDPPQKFIPTKILWYKKKR